MGESIEFIQSRCDHRNFSIHWQTNVWGFKQKEMVNLNVVDFS